MDTINNRKITLDADLLLDAEMQTLEGGVASEGCAVDHSEISLHRISLLVQWH